jgi:hypothetical protein
MNPVLEAAEKSSRNVAGHMCIPKSDNRLVHHTPHEDPLELGILKNIGQFIKIIAINWA